MKKSTLICCVIGSIMVVCLTGGIFIHNKDKADMAVMASVETEQSVEHMEDKTETAEISIPTENSSMGSEDAPLDDELTQRNKDAEEEADTADEGLNESTEIVEELDKDMYAIKNCNIRSGDGTNYEKIGSLEYLSKPHVTGKTANGWYRIVWGDGEAYVSASFLSDTKPQSQPSGGGNTNSDSGDTNNSNTTNPDGSDSRISNIFGGGTGATGGHDSSGDNWGGY